MGAMILLTEALHLVLWLREISEETAVMRSGRGLETVNFT